MVYLSLIKFSIKCFQRIVVLNRGTNFSEIKSRRNNNCRHKGRVNIIDIQYALSTMAILTSPEHDKNRATKNFKTLTQAQAK